MKQFRVVMLLAVITGLSAAAFFWSRRTPSETTATPAECLARYYEAGRAGDVGQYLSCLGEPYRSLVRQRSSDDTLSAALQRDMEGLKSWVQLAEPGEEGPSGWVDVDEVRVAGTRRVRFHLRREGSGWVIVAVDPPREMPTPIRYGTHISEGP